MSLSDIIRKGGFFAAHTLDIQIRSRNVKDVLKLYAFHKTKSFHTVKIDKEFFCTENYLLVIGLEFGGKKKTDF